MGNQELPELSFKIRSKTFQKTKKAIFGPFLPIYGKKAVFPKNQTSSIFAY